MSFPLSIATPSSLGLDVPSLDRLQELITRHLAEGRYPGAQIAVDADAVFAEAQLIVKVKEPQPEEYERFRADHVLFTYLHLAADEKLTRFLVDRGVRAVAYETVQTADGRLPLLAPMSEIAGRMAPQEGAKYLERPSGGRGVLMGGASGVMPAKVVVLGAGMMGAAIAYVCAKAGIELDRKSLAELAAREPAAFTKLAEKAKAAAA
jgi:alanine dehydrogenase